MAHPDTKVEKIKIDEIFASFIIKLHI